MKPTLSKIEGHFMYKIRRELAKTK